MRRGGNALLLEWKLMMLSEGSLLLLQGQARQAKGAPAVVACEGRGPALLGAERLPARRGQVARQRTARLGKRPPRATLRLDANVPTRLCQELALAAAVLLCY